MPPVAQRPTSLHEHQQQGAALTGASRKHIAVVPPHLHSSSHMEEPNSGRLPRSNCSSSDGTSSNVASTPSSTLSLSPSTSTSTASSSASPLALASNWLLPPSRFAARPTLVLDLDGTLIGSSDNAKSTQPYGGVDRVEAVFTPDSPDSPTGKTETRYIWLRPHARKFLETLRPHFEIVLWTAANRAWADRALAVLDPHGRLFDHRLYDEHTLKVPMECGSIKDLALIGRPMSRTIIVEDSVQAVLASPENSIWVSSWQPHNHDDDVLRAVMRFILAKIVDQRDVRVPLAALHRGEQDVRTSACGRRNGTTTGSAVPEPPSPAMAAGSGSRGTSTSTSASTTPHAAAHSRGTVAPAPGDAKCFAPRVAQPPPLLQQHKGRPPSTPTPTAAASGANGASSSSASEPSTPLLPAINSRATTGGTSVGSTSSRARGHSLNGAADASPRSVATPHLPSSPHGWSPSASDTSTTTTTPQATGAGSGSGTPSLLTRLSSKLLSPFMSSKGDKRSSSVFSRSMATSCPGVPPPVPK